jgi:hypothetical protein
LAHELLPPSIASVSNRTTEITGFNSCGYARNAETTMTRSRNVADLIGVVSRNHDDSKGSALKALPPALRCRSAESPSREALKIAKPSVKAREKR